MNKEKLLQLISEALDKGAYLNIHMSQYDQSNNWKPVYKDTAFDYANQFKEAIGASEIKESEGGKEEIRSFDVKKDEITVYCSFHTYMEEDVDLTGGVEDVG